MARGRPPKPLEQRRRTGRGNNRDSAGRRLPDLATVTTLPGAEGIPPLPDDLKTTELAATCRSRPRDSEDPCRTCLAELGREAWNRLWTAGQTWLSPQTDLDVLIRLCKARVEEAHHRTALAEDGYYVKGQRGGLVAHPAVAMLRTITAEITKLEGLCGFTPSDRGRMGVGEVKRRASALEELLQKRTGQHAKS